MPTITITPESRNAMRQPHDMNCSSVSSHDSNATTPEAMHSPIASPICGSEA